MSGDEGTVSKGGNGISRKGFTGLENPGLILLG